MADDAEITSPFVLFGGGVSLPKIEVVCNRSDRRSGVCGLGYTTMTFSSACIFPCFDLFYFIDWGSHWFTLITNQPSEKSPPS